MEGSVGLFDACGNGWSVSTATEFSGNSFEGLILGVPSGGSTLVR